MISHDALRTLKMHCLYECELLFCTHPVAQWDASKRCPQMFFKTFTSNLYSFQVVSIICCGKETMRIIRTGDNWKNESWESFCFESIHTVGGVTTSILLAKSLIFRRMSVFENWEVVQKTWGVGQIRITRMCWICGEHPIVDSLCHFHAFSFWSLVYCIYFLHGVPPLPLRYILRYRCCFNHPWVFVYATYEEFKKPTYPGVASFLKVDWDSLSIQLLK